MQASRPSCVTVSRMMIDHHDMKLCFKLKSKNEERTDGWRERREEAAAQFLLMHSGTCLVLALGIEQVSLSL